MFSCLYGLKYSKDLRLWCTHSLVANSEHLVLNEQFME